MNQSRVPAFLREYLSQEALKSLWAMDQNLDAFLSNPYGRISPSIRDLKSQPERVEMVVGVTTYRLQEITRLLVNLMVTLWKPVVKRTPQMQEPDVLRMRLEDVYGQLVAFYDRLTFSERVVGLHVRFKPGPNHAPGDVIEISLRVSDLNQISSDHPVGRSREVLIGVHSVDSPRPRPGASVDEQSLTTAAVMLFKSSYRKHDKQRGFKGYIQALSKTEDREVVDDQIVIDAIADTLRNGEVVKLGPVIKLPQGDTTRVFRPLRDIERP